MSVFARVWAALRGTPAPDSPRFDSPAWWGEFGAIPANMYLSAEEQMAVSVAWACIRAIVDPIAASEIKVYEDDGGKRREEPPTSSLYWLLNMEPHPQYTSQGWTEAVLTPAIATGNGYAYIRRNGLRQAAALQPLDPYRMLADDDGGSGVVYRYNDPINGEVRIPEADVLHFRGPRGNGFYGFSPLIVAASALALAKAQERYATAYYSNNALPGVMLKPPNNAAPMSLEQRAQVREAFKVLIGGPKKARGVAVLNPGWDLEVIETDADKSQMVESRKWQVTEIARYFGVPGHLVGVPESSQGYGKNLAELGLGFVRQTLQPWARRLEEELRKKLMPERRGRRWFLEYDLTRLTKGDDESVARAEEIAIRNGVLTINEARGLRGMPSVKGGDTTLVNGKPLEEVLNPPAPPAPVAPVEEPEEDEEDVPGAVAAALERHAKRLKARTADLQAKGKDAESPKHIASLRTKARSDIRGLVNGRKIEGLDAAILSVEAGIPPMKAAHHLLGSQ
jgi:HK97 family phage portal protein